MRVLVACEFSGVVRRAFRSRGHDAWSCDLLPAIDEDEHHYRGDVRAYLGDGWDLMVAHPPCTHLAVSGARYFARKGREQAAALDFVWTLMTAPIERIAVENPVSVISSRIRRPDQIIQPWQFGHSESKATCLWLKNLPPLASTKVMPLPASGRWNNQTPSGQNKLPPSADRWALRSMTYEGIAAAMAEQWGGMAESRNEAFELEAAMRATRPPERRGKEGAGPEGGNTAAHHYILAPPDDGSPGGAH